MSLYVYVKNSRFILHTKLFQFLMRLNDTCGNVRSTLLIRLPLPTLNEAYYVFIQEESQRGITISISLTNSTINTSLNTRPNFTNARRNNMGPRRIPICQHCNRQGHLMESCRILHPELKNTRIANGNFSNSSNATQSYNHILDTSDTESTYNSTQNATNSSQSFTQEQYE